MYIGTQPYSGIRARHTYTATAGQTSFSGAGAENVTLTYSDELYIDVYQNGVKLSPADYTATSGTTVVLGTGATVSDIVEVIKYDAFSVADTVSAKDGGGFGGNISTSGTLAVTGTSTLTGNTTVGGTLGVTGNSTVGGTLGVTGATTLSSDLTIPDKIIHSGDTDTVIRFSDANEVKVETGGDEIVKFSSGATVFNNGGVNMDFRVEGDTDTELFFIDAGNEKLSIGTSTSDGFLHIKKNFQSDIGMSMNDTSGSGGTAIRFKINGTTKGSIAYSGSGTSFNTSSDYRLKENVSYTWDATSRIKQLKPARFNWINDDTNTFVDGFLAHEVSSIVPEAITGEKDDTQDVGTLKDKDGNVKAENVPESVKENAEHTWTKTGKENVYQEIDQDKLVPLLVKSLQEALTEIDTLKTKVAALESA